VQAIINHFQYASVQVINCGLSRKLWKTDIYSTSFEFYMYSKQILCVPIAFTKEDTTVPSDNSIDIMQSNFLWIEL
jgi:hypothetical protein